MTTTTTDRTQARKPEEEPPTGEKKRRAPVKRVTGMKRVSFLLPEKEHQALEQIADNDDRRADDLARVLTRKHIRSNAVEAVNASP
jgi:hypothetical protein